MIPEIKVEVTNVLKELGIAEIDFTVEHPSDLSHGDYACNVAMVAAKQGGTNPREIAEKIVTSLEGRMDVVEKIEVAGPGFINFHLSRDFFKEKIANAREAKCEWGANESLKGQKIVVEYTDPNPFKEFHVGHLFTNSVGESVARLFMANGADVKRVNYQGDVGMHVACALYGMEELGFAGARDFSATELGKAYALGAKALKEDEEAKEKIVAINKMVYERSDESINALYDKGRAVSLEYFDSIYKLLDTEFDHMFFESEAAPRGKEIVLEHKDIFPESDGAYVFKGEEYGLHTRVFLNQEGLPTYEAKELALPKMKEEALGKYDLSVISTANEINEYFKVLLKAMEFVYPELAKKTEHIGHGMVRLATGKMSSRTGDVITALSFIEEIATAAAEKIRERDAELAEDTDLARNIAIGAIKYGTLKSNILQDSVFNKEQALSFEGDSGPYLMYTHARICSVLEKAQTAGVTPSSENVPEEPYEIEKILYRFEEVVQVACEERAPHQVTHYLTELAGAFNTFYAHEKIADSSDEYAPYKAAVADAVRVTLQNGLWMLAIKAPERM